MADSKSLSLSGSNELNLPPASLKTPRREGMRGGAARNLSDFGGSLTLTGYKLMIDRWHWTRVFGLEKIQQSWRPLIFAYCRLIIENFDYDYEQVDDVAFGSVRF